MQVLEWIVSNNLLSDGTIVIYQGGGTPIQTCEFRAPAIQIVGTIDSMRINGTDYIVNQQYLSLAALNQIILDTLDNNNIPYSSAEVIPEGNRYSSFVRVLSTDNIILENIIQDGVIKSYINNGCQ